MAKLSELTLQNVKAAVRVDYDYDDELLGHISDAAKSYIANFTGLTASQLDEIPEMCIAFYCLCNDMYDNRSMTVSTGNENPTVIQILKGNAVNYV